jgi:hypothetical protein
MNVKNSIVSIVVAVSSVLIAMQAFSYEYTFLNNTTDIVNIIVTQGIDENTDANKALGCSKDTILDVTIVPGQTAVAIPKPGCCLFAVMLNGQVVFTGGDQTGMLYCFTGGFEIVKKGALFELNRLVQYEKRAPLGLKE